jgi:hypothetical protein
MTLNSQGSWKKRRVKEKRKWGEDKRRKRLPDAVLEEF